MADASICETFQRHLNGLRENDRNTRKKSLQALLDKLPFVTSIKISSNDDTSFISFLASSLFPVLVDLLYDPVEKCREISLLLIEKCFKNEAFVRRLTDSSNGNAFLNFVRKLCAKLYETHENDAFEKSEEIRVKILEVLHVVIKTTDAANTTSNGMLWLVHSEVVDNVSSALLKALADPSPHIKKESTDIAMYMSGALEKGMNCCFKEKLLKPIIANMQHQHSKVRLATIRTAASMMKNLSEADFEKIFNESFVSVFLKIVFDQNIAIRKELLDSLLMIVMQQMTLRNATVLSDSSSNIPILIDVDDSSPNNFKVLREADQNILSMIMLLAADESSELAAVAKQGFLVFAKCWDKCFCNNDNDSDEIVIGRFIDINLQVIINVIFTGIKNWNVLYKKRYWESLSVFLLYSKDNISEVVSQLLPYLSEDILSEEMSIRQNVQKCCSIIGNFCISHQIYNNNEVSRAKNIIDTLISRVVDDADTNLGNQKITSLKILTSLLDGSPLDDVADSYKILLNVSHILSTIQIYHFNETVMCESIVLLAKLFIDKYPTQITENYEIQQNILCGLLFTCSRVFSGNDVIAETSMIYLNKLMLLDLIIAQLKIDFNWKSKYNKDVYNDNFSKICNNFTSSNEKDKFIKKHFRDIVLKFINFSKWDEYEPVISAFEVLINEFTASSWQNHDLVLPIIISNSKPEKEELSVAKQNELKYASVRGEEDFSNRKNIDIRLALLAIMEGLLAKGSVNEQCFVHIDRAAEMVMNHIVNNLVWRVGSVEATIRKVALTICYELLRGDGITPTFVVKIAGEIIPLLLNNLDDTETSTRHLCSLCLRHIYTKAAGAFGDQAINDMYPVLLKRLDDADDNIRIEICNTLTSFFSAGQAKFYGETMVDYTLEQLYVHIFDTNLILQTSVSKVIVKIFSVVTDSQKKSKKLSLLDDKLKGHKLYTNIISAIDKISK